MKIPAETPKKEIPTVDKEITATDTRGSQKSEKSSVNTELENYFNPQDTVEISSNAKKLNAQSNSKVVTLPAGNENFVADTSKVTQRNKIKQIAALITNGKKISEADAKFLKQADPQLYAQIKSKLKTE